MTNLMFLVDLSLKIFNKLNKFSVATQIKKL